MKLPWIQRASFYIYSCEAALLNQFGICYSTSKQVNCKWSCVSIALFPVHSALKVLRNTCHIHPFKHTFIHWWKRKKKNGEKPVSRQRLSSFVMFVYNPHVWRCEVPLEFSASFQGLFCLKKKTISVVFLNRTHDQKHPVLKLNWSLFISSIWPWGFYSKVRCVLVYAEWKATQRQARLHKCFC